MTTEEARPPQTVRETALDNEVSPAPDATPTESDALGLALSGGGVRAALFSLGVVIGLIETGCHRRVRCVASVSGGSIVNAALAHARSLGDFTTVEDFNPLASRLAASLALKGAFAFDRRTIFAALWYLFQVIGRAILPVGFALIYLLSFLINWLREKQNIDLAHLDYSRVTWQAVVWILVALLASLLISALLSRGLLQEAKYASVLGYVAGVSTDTYKPNVKDWGAPSPESGPRVWHVLVATDLLSGEPIYFSTQFVHCKPYGWSVPGDISTKAALYSSAAFPAAFPPKKLKLSKLNFQNGRMKGPLPRVLRLADGGVYNNLGTDWFDVLLAEQSRPSRPMLWPFGELKKIDPPKIETKNIIVVNAGAPISPVQRLLPFPLSLSRIMSVLYDNTVKPRVRLIRDVKGPLIDIVESPVKMATRLAEELEGEAGGRANALAMRLEARDPGFWDNFSHETAGMKTKLTGAGNRQGARLMLHGYLSSLVLLHVRFKAKLPEQIRGEEYFLSLVSRSKSPSVPNEPAAETPK